MASSRKSPIANFFRRPTPHVPNGSSDDLEFQESDLYFNDPISSSSSSCKSSKNKVKLLRMRSATAKVASAEESRSVPVSIPAWSTRRMVQAESEGSDEDEDEKSNNRLPPHEYLARKRGASLSIHEGVGRTLKGRDMSRVRNAVWKQIGFED